MLGHRKCPEEAAEAMEEAPPCDTQDSGVSGQPGGYIPLASKHLALVGFTYEKKNKPNPLSDLAFRVSSPLALAYKGYE